MSLDFLIWIVIAVALAIAEIFTAGFFIIFFAVGAALTAISTFFIHGQVAQLVVFLITSILLLITARPLLKKTFRITDLPLKKSNVSTLINEEILVIEPTDRYNGKVKVLHTGEIWSAYIASTNDETTIMEKGEEGFVSEVDGAKLVIRPKKP